MSKKTTKAYAQYAILAQRSLNLFDLHEPVGSFLKSQNIDSRQVDSDDIARASVVLAVAAMDAYFTDVFCELLVPYLKKKGPTKKMVEIIEEAGLTVRFALELIKKDRPYRHIRTLIERHFAAYTTQQLATVDKLFTAFGVKKLTVNAEKKARRKTLRSGVTSLVKRRHGIVHNGDRNQHGNPKRIAHTTLKNQIEKSIKLIAQCDQILTGLL